MAEILNIETPDFHLVYGLTDTFVEICTALPRESHKLIHTAIYDCLKVWFDEIEDRELRAYLIDIFTQIGLTARIQDFLEFTPLFIEKYAKNYSELPLSRKAINRLVDLNTYCLQAMKDEKGRLYERYIGAQLGICERLKMQCPQFPALVAHFLVQAEASSTLDLTLVHKTRLELTQHYPPLGQYLRHGTEILSPRLQSKPPSFVLTVWIGMADNFQNLVLTLSQRLGMLATLVEKEEHSLQTSLFGAVKYFIAANILRGGVQINYPSVCKTVQDFAEFYNSTTGNQNISAPINDNVRGLLAQDVGFAFVGNYLMGGVQYGVPYEVLQLAKDFWEDIKKEMQQDKKDKRKAIYGPDANRPLELEIIDDLKQGFFEKRVTDFLQEAEVMAYCKEQKIPGFKGIDGDGNCFFRAVLASLGENEDEHLALRLAAIAYIQKHRDYFIKTYGDELYINEKSLTLDGYLLEMMQDKCWGDGAIIEATALCKNIKIDMIQLTKNKASQIETEGRFSAVGSNDANTILLLRVNNNHYHATVSQKQLALRDKHSVSNGKERSEDSPSNNTRYSDLLRNSPLYGAPPQEKKEKNKWECLWEEIEVKEKPEGILFKINIDALSNENLITIQEIAKGKFGQQSRSKPFVVTYDSTEEGDVSRITFKNKDAARNFLKELNKAALGPAEASRPKA